MNNTWFNCSKKWCCFQYPFLLKILENGYVIVIMQLLLAVGTKLEHVITQLAGDVAAKHIAVEGDLVVKPSDDHFWFHRPRLVLLLIHIILFQNSFEIAFFFWIWVILKNITLNS